MVAAMTLKFLDPFGSGKIVLFQVTYDRVNTLSRTGYPVDLTKSVRIGMHMSLGFS